MTSPFDLSQRPVLVLHEPSAMNTNDKPAAGKEASKPEPSRLDEVRRVLEQYVNDLREIIRKLRRKLN
jgi:hypothetical protein